MDAIITFVAFILIISLLVLVHEFGHFMAAKLVDVHVLEFAIGFGKTLFAREWKGTVYKFNLFPLGGYVQLEGETEELLPTKPVDPEHSYMNKPLWAKIVILTGGVVMNFVLACFLFAAYLGINNYQVSLLRQAEYNFVGIDEANSYPAVLAVSKTVEGSPAEGKIIPGDLIVSANGEKLRSSDQFLEFLNNNLNQQVQLGILNPQTYEIRTVAIDLGGKNPETGSILGANFATFYFISYPKNALSGISHSVNVLGYQLKVIGDLISKAIAESKPQVFVDQVVSVVGVGAVVGDIVAVRQFGELINLTAVISVALAFFNILPIPALDGGQVVVAVIERVRGKKLNSALVEKVNQVALVVLLLFSVLIMFKDVFQFGIVDNVISGVRGVIGR